MLGIDLGSNTLRALEMDKNFEKIAQYEFIIGAAKNLNTSGKIGDEAISNLREALRTLALKYELKEACIVATAAFRKASNARELFEELKQEFGAEFRIIDAKTEARLSVLGMKTGLLNLGLSGEFAYCDLGGASCELSFKGVLKSFDFGIVTFYEKAELENLGQKLKINKTSLKKYPHFIQKLKDKKLKLHFLIRDKRLCTLAFKAFDELKGIKKQLFKFKAKRIVLNSGVPTSLCALKLGLSYENYDFTKINGKKLCVNDFLKFGIKLWNMQENEAREFVGNSRKNYVVAGCFLFFALFEKQKLIVVDEGLREGVCIAKLKNMDF